MKINIKAHFDEEKKKHEELVAKVESEKEKLKSELTLKWQGKDQLEKEKKKKEMLLRQNEEEGLDGTKLKGKIQELDSQIAQAASDLEALKKEEQSSGGVVQRTFERENLMVYVLAGFYQCEEASVVESADDVFKLLPFKVTELDKAGRPAKCKIQIVSDDSREFTIKPSDKHFWKDFRPKSLKWLPLEKQELEKPSQHTNTPERIRAFFDKSKSALLLTKTSVSWSVTRKTGRQVYSQRHNEYVSETETTEFKDDFSDMAVSLGVRIDGLVEPEKNELSLEQEYTDNPLFAHMRSEVVARTVNSPRFKECKEHLASDEIYQHIKVDWDAFKNSPWSAAVSGTLALLKYHVENGEKARFWSGDFVGQFGFRLRTRDHDWIVGELFVDDAEKAIAAKPVLKIYKPQSEFDQVVVAGLGRIFLRVFRDP